MRAPVAVVLFLALCCAGSAAALDTNGALRAPRLEIVRATPLTIRGYGFGAREHIRIIVSAGRLATKRVSTTAAGTFRVTLRLAIGRCTAIVVQAFAAGGRRAMVDRPAPECFDP